MAEDNVPTGAEPRGGADAIPESLRAKTDAAVQKSRSHVSGGQDVPAEHSLSPPLTPTVQNEGEASGDKARGRSLGETQSSFSQRLEELRQLFRDVATPHCREASDRDGR